MYVERPGPLHCQTHPPSSLYTIVQLILSSVIQYRPTIFPHLDLTGPRGITALCNTLHHHIITLSICLYYLLHIMSEPKDATKQTCRENEHHKKKKEKTFFFHLERQLLKKSILSKEKKYSF